MRSSIILILILLSIFSCKTGEKRFDDKPASTSVSDTVRIANDELQYEVIIIDPGFSTWLTTRALPRQHYTQSFLEGRNRIWITEWNNRFLNRRYGDLYDMRIDYNNSIDYGFEVNYLIYNYLVYFQNKFSQKLGGYVPAR